MIAEVYPRVCGGTVSSYRAIPSPSGLSPRVRGNPVSGTSDGYKSRSIPACAGEPPSASLLPARLGVYPRVCGGTGRPAKRSDIRWRSIPACAGEPIRAKTSGIGRRVYPRVCGGTRAIAASQWLWTGLSPRVRGNLQIIGQVFGQRGSIPACAGEPESAVDRMFSTKVYPRVCGGTGGRVRDAGDECGLSPRVRGNRLSAHRAWPSSRSIPACAGEPAMYQPAGQLG